MAFWNKVIKKIAEYTSFKKKDKIDDNIVNTPSIDERIEQQFDLTLDVKTLSSNLYKLQSGEKILGDLSLGEKGYLVKRLREKAAVIREAYNNNKYDYMAIKFEELAYNILNTNGSMSQVRSLPTPSKLEKSLVLQAD